MTSELDKALSEDAKLKIICDMAATAKERGEIQQRLQDILRKIVFDREYPDGTPVLRESVWARCVDKLHSMVPEKVLEKTAGVMDDAQGELRIRLVLDASTSDPNVKEAEVLDMFTTKELPEPGPWSEEE